MNIEAFESNVPTDFVPEKDEFEAVLSYLSNNAPASQTAMVKVGRHYFPNFRELYSEIAKVAIFERENELYRKATGFAVNT